jgi:hypothetical protein
VSLYRLRHPPHGHRLHHHPADHITFDIEQLDVEPFTVGFSGALPGRLNLPTIRQRSIKTQFVNPATDTCHVLNDLAMLDGQTTAHWQHVIAPRNSPRGACEERASGSTTD